MNIAILGASFGDEGKGRIVHDFSPHYDWIIRFSGGANAGHTIYRDGVKYVHNLLPSFDWRSSRPKAFLASGMVIDLEQLHIEISTLYKINKIIPSRIYVDPDAFIVTPEHKALDKAQNSHIGSTNRGIGPAYVSKINRSGIRIRDIMSSSVFNKKWNEDIENMKKMGVHFVGLLELQNEMKKSSLLFEGAQGVLLDINHGIYPYVSCGEATISGIYSSGFTFIKLDKVFGVAKCYTTKVGEGPFPTEIFNEEANALRERGKEYGATTGRPRRIGWLDLPAIKYAVQKGGIDGLIITKFDILNGMKNVPVAVSYDKTPLCSNDFLNTKVHLNQFPGWNNAKNTKELMPFISQVELVVGIPIAYISYGTNPEDLFQLHE